MNTVLLLSLLFLSSQTIEHSFPQSTRNCNVGRLLLRRDNGKQSQCIEISRAKQAFYDSFSTSTNEYTLGHSKLELSRGFARSYLPFAIQNFLYGNFCKPGIIALEPLMNEKEIHKKNKKN